MTLDAALAEIGQVVCRAPYAYSTSWALEEVELVGRDGHALHVLVKRLDEAPATKPRDVVDREREIQAYALLEGRGLGTPRCYASGRWWLIIEKVSGVELWQRGDLEAWRAAASWAATLHRAFSGTPIEASALLRHDEAFYRRVIERARARRGPELTPFLVAADVAVRRLIRLPSTLVHGELYPSNVLVAPGRVAVVDWEMAALGPGVLDIAALMTGWDPDAQRALLEAYGDPYPADVAAAQFILAHQWLGWHDDWEPPLEHRRDWLAEARAAAEMLE